MLVGANIERNGGGDRSWLRCLFGATGPAALQNDPPHPEDNDARSRGSLVRAFCILKGALSPPSLSSWLGRVALAVVASACICHHIPDAPFNTRTMHLNSALAILAASSRLALASPATDKIAIDPALRLIKTSETDPGTWVTDEQKIENYVNKHIGFIDITDITVRGLQCSHF